MKNRHTTFLLILLSLLILFAYCISLHIFGERITLKVKGKNDKLSKIYLKSNNDNVALSEVPDMRGWWDDPHTAIPCGLIILYKNTIDTLYVVWFNPDPQRPPLETNANIIFIYEPGYNHELVDGYIANGFSIFPKNHYQ